MRLDNEKRAGPRRRSRDFFKLCAVLLVIGVAAQSYRAVYAQAWPLATANGVVADDTGKLDAAGMGSAAQELKSLGVKPFALLTQTGLGFPNSDALARAAAAQYGLGSNGGSVLDPNLLL